MRLLARNLPPDRAAIDVTLEAVGDVGGALPSFVELDGRKRYAVIPLNQHVEIRVVPQSRPFSPTTFMIQNARDWHIHGFRIGNKPQLIGPPGTEMPGEVLSGVTFVSDKIEVGQDYAITVSYVGTSDEPQPFICDVIGDAL